MEERERRVETVLDAVVGTLDGGAPREGQQRMADAVADAFTQREHLLVQAGTGTGKSLAYLVPAVLTGERVVIVTATRALQEQLVRKDIPFLARATEDLGITFTSAQLKGRSNYLCRAREAELVADRAGALTGINADDDVLDAVIDWVEDTDTGDRAEIPVAVPDSLWEVLSVDARECPGRTRCSHGAQCFAEAARDRAADAQIVVVNSALYAQHLAAAGNVLPPHSYAVIDEGHTLEEVCSDAFGVDLGPGRLSRVAAHVRGFLTNADGSDPAGRLVERSIRLGMLLNECRNEAPVDLDQTGLRSALNGIAEAVGALRDTTNKVDPGEHDASQRKQRVLRLLDSTRDDIAYALGANAERDAMWVERREPPVLKVARIDVGEQLMAQLFARRTVVMTSATLALGDDFGHLAWRIGLRDDAKVDEIEPRDGETAPTHPTRYRALDVGSPFEYRKQAILYCAAHLPEPRSPKYDEAWLPEAIELVRAAGGRTLGLCTSLAAAQRLRDALKDALPDIKVLAPDDLPRAALMDAFAADETSCLVGSLGLWQGIDVAGPSVTLVLIDKLPFQRPDDPLARARRDQAEARGHDPFVTYDLPRAARLLAQGVGRLVRRAEDRGVVAVLDPRLVTKRYGAQLVASLPPMYRMTDPKRVKAALERLAAESPEADAAGEPA
jgi:ATP-dependent DNA helicase DinG